jgi:hypothetical protein
MEKVTDAVVGLRLAAVFLLAATFSTSSTAAEPAPSAVTRIVIDDDWVGHSPTTPHRSHWVIEPRGSAYVLSGTYSQQHMEKKPHYSRTEERDVTNVTDQPVPGPAVDALVRALRAPPQPTIDLALFGATIHHAGAAIDDTVKQLLDLSPPPPMRQRILDWASTLRQGQPLARAITVGVATDFHSDDFPQVRVEASFADGSHLAFSSGSQNRFLMPWHDASGHASFAADLPKAVYALLPTMSANRGRLSGEPSEDELDAYLATGMAEDKARFQVQIVAPQAYATLESRFTIRDINPVDTSSHRLFVTVSLPDGPKNLTLRTKLAISGTALAKPSDMDGMMEALNTAAAATGLRQAMLSAPDHDFHMEPGIGIQPFNAEAKKQFIEQMREAHKLPELATHPHLLDGAVIVEQGDYPTYWIALRDRRSIEWKRFVGVHVEHGGRMCAGVPVTGEDWRSVGNTDECISKVYDAAGHAL